MEMAGPLGTPLGLAQRKRRLDSLEAAQGAPSRCEDEAEQGFCKGPEQWRKRQEMACSVSLTQDHTASGQLPLVCLALFPQGSQGLFLRVK